jgi:hypothetical protein
VSTPWGGIKCIFDSDQPSHNFLPAIADSHHDRARLHEALDVRQHFALSAAIRAGVPACRPQADLPLDDGQFAQKIFGRLQEGSPIKKSASAQHG